MQLTVGVKAHYALEFISERFDKMGEEEKMKVIIHELMHIPKSFGGGFKHHDWVCDKNINLFYRKYINMKQSDLVTEEIVDQNLSSENNGDERNKRLRDFLKW